MLKTERNCMMFIRNMKRIKIKLTFTLLFLLLVLVAQAQTAGYLSNANFPLKKDWLDVHVRKSGPYLGAQRGKYLIAEIGGEVQFKKVKLIRPVTHAFHTGFNYNFKYNVLGYDLGYWFKVGRLDLTYGANLVMRTDFNETRLGVAPVVGFKLFQFHLQTGYHFLTPARTFTETNKFFVSLRFVMISKRDIDIDRNSKKKKDKEKGKDKDKGGLFKR